MEPEVRFNPDGRSLQMEIPSSLLVRNSFLIACVSIVASSFLLITPEGRPSIVFVLLILFSGIVFWIYAISRLRLYAKDTSAKNRATAARSNTTSIVAILLAMGVSIAAAWIGLSVCYYNSQRSSGMDVLNPMSDIEFRRMPRNARVAAMREMSEEEQFWRQKIRLARVREEWRAFELEGRWRRPNSDSSSTGGSW